MDWKDPEKIEAVRADLCDIAWLLKGIKMKSKDWPLSSQEESLGRVIIMLSGLKIEALKQKSE